MLAWSSKLEIEKSIIEDKYILVVLIRNLGHLIREKEKMQLKWQKIVNQLKKRNYIIIPII